MAVSYQIKDAATYVRSINPTSLHLPQRNENLGSLSTKLFAHEYSQLFIHEKQTLIKEIQIAHQKSKQISGYPLNK